MITLIVLGAIICFLLVLCFLPLSIDLVYEDDCVFKIKYAGITLINSEKSIKTKAKNHKKDTNTTPEKKDNFIKKTYNKYYFSDLKGEYIYYNGTDEEHMVPDDAFAIGINYKVNYKEEEDFDKKREQVDDIIIEIINNIQSNDSNIKIAVIENNGMKLNNDFLL